VEKRRFRQLAKEAEQYSEINRTEITKHDIGNQKYRQDRKEEEGVSSYRITSGKEKIPSTGKRS
jgi:hypothetical protein